MVAGQFGRHQLFPRGAAFGIGVADAGLFVVWDAAGHRPRRHEHRRQMAEGRRRHDQARHDLVANAQIKCGVETVVAHRHPGGQRDHVAAEQRQFHPRLALGHPVAHRGHPARDLHRDPGPGRRRADQVGIAFERLMRRQHVVVGRDDPQVWHLGRGQSRFRRAHRGIGVGLVAAGQMRADRACRDRLAQPVQIGVACGARPAADAVGDAGDRRVQGHRLLRCGRCRDHSAVC